MIEIDWKTAIIAIIMAPFGAIVASGLFYTLSTVQATTESRVDGPFSGAVDSLGTAISVVEGLFQLASNIELLFASGVLGLFAIGLLPEYFSAFSTGR